MRRWALGAALLPVAVSGNFASSLHSNFVVNLDFESLGKDEPAGQAQVKESDTKLMAFAGGQQKFRCHLPSSTGQSAGSGDQADMQKLKTQFRNAKMASLKGRCLKTGPLGYWSYEVCPGNKITQFRADTDIVHDLGHHDPEYDELYSNGSASEWYYGGTDNRSTVVRYVCGASEPRKFKVEETAPMTYSFIIGAPSFCSWRENEGAETQDEAGRVMKVSALLEDLRGNCINVTQQWWTYEYCFPDTMRQFHLSSNGRVRDPEHALGTLNGTDAVTAPNLVEMAIVKQKKTSLGLSDRRGLPSSQRMLQQHLGGGAVCDETRRARATNMFFRCPSDWQTAPLAKILSITEGTLCEYDIVVQTTLLCGHHGFLPALPRGREAIKCVAEPQSEL